MASSYRTLGARSIKVHFIAHIGQIGELITRHAGVRRWLVDADYFGPDTSVDLANLSVSFARRPQMALKSSRKGIEVDLLVAASFSAIRDVETKTGQNRLPTLTMQLAMHRAKVHYVITCHNRSLHQSLPKTYKN